MSQLSPFHAELLDFLQRETEKRSEEEGFCLEKDSELRELKRAFAASKERYSLSEVLERYQYLFEERGPVHIEQKIFEVFSRKEFAALGMEKDFPKIYRALPRVYHPEKPSQSRIKKNFTHLPTLLRLMVEKAVFRLYEGLEVSKNARLAVLTWIFPDGSGDYYAAEEIVTFLKRHFRVDWIALVPKEFSLPKGSLAQAIRYVKKSPLTLFKKEVLELLRSADLVLQCPTYYPETPALIEKIGNLRLHSIGEYGFVESSWFHPRSGNRSMGLHFLEKGILFPKPVEKKWSHLQCKQLLRWLPEKPSRFYLAYLSTIAGGMVYLHALFKSLEEEGSDIDLCIPDLRWLIRLVEEKGVLLEADFGIREVEVYFDKKSFSFPMRKKGKRVRIFSPDALSHDDFQALLSHSGEFVAVRGNQSFSEAVALGKVFFYDGREHARYFFKDLLALAENRLQAYQQTLTCLRGMGKTFLHNLPLDEGEWVDETHFQEKEPLLEIALEMGTALKSGEVAAGFKKLAEILKEEHSFEDFLYPFVSRELYHMRHPDIAAEEKMLLERFARGVYSFTELIAMLRKSLK